MKKSTIFSLKKRKDTASRSQALLEFALALPILLMLLFGIIDLAALFQAWLTVENIARQTVRYAVTGQYDPAFCQDLDASGKACDSDEEQDAARLKSVQEYANKQVIALFYTPGAAQDAIGHLNITICSTRDADPKDKIPDFTFFPSSNSDYSDCRKNNISTSDAGGPGDRVIIAVDFNHPYITPIFNQIWPYTHLFSYREGIVEEFRVPRLIALPPEVGLPSDTPTNPPPATSTGTATNTATATNTPLPIYIQITNPDPSGITITSVEQTRFEAIAWDPAYGTSNGNGIDNIKFWFDGPGTIPGGTESQKAYCAFSGNGPCNRIDVVMDYTTLPNGTYTIYARAQGTDGRFSEIVSKQFILNFPPTPTPTITNTPTNTPLPTCNDVFIVDRQVRDRSTYSDFRVTVQNNNQADGYLISSSMTWDSPYSPPLYFDYFWFLNTDTPNIYYDPNPTNWYDDKTHSTISWSDTKGAPAPLAGEAKTLWGARFRPAGAPALAGTFNVTLTFYFPVLGNCVVSTNLIQPTPLPTAIPPTNTPVTPTATPVCNLSGSVFTSDFYGNPQNVNGYDCAYGCIHSPYLTSNNLPPGTYFWILETVGSGSVQVNNGTFVLQPGQQAGPQNGVVVPLGLNMYNVPPNYFPGEFKVTVYQSTAAGCNSKTDNIKIQAAAPTPEPTNTKAPTNTPKPTSTPAPATDTPIPPTNTPFCTDC